MILNKKQAEFATVYVNNPDMNLGDISREIGVHRNTITNWLNDKEFVESLYQTYMQTFGAKLPSVLQAMYSEAINGNVQAGRLILEHSGKLVKNVEVKVESPFERFLQGTKKIENAIEVVEEEKKLLEEQKESPTEKLNKQKSDSKKLLSRAKKVGLKPLGPGRHTKTKRKEWLLELEKLELESA